MTDRQLRRARNDVGVFAKLVGCALAAYQVAAAQLRKRTTVWIAPRQTGKSRTLAVLAVWTAFRLPNQRVLIVSAGEEASRRLLSEVRRIVTGSELLAGSVTDELAGLVTLSNGSEIRSVPASERQVRGWTVDLLLVDEAALVDDALLLGAAIPTTAARPDARIVLAGSPAAPEGAFYRYAAAGEQGADHVDSFTWRLADAGWIGEDVIQAARDQLPPELFAREFEASFSDVGADERVIDRRWIEEAQARSLEPAGNAAYGLDVARSGSDKSVLALAVGGVVRTVFETHGADLMTLTGKVARILDERPAPVHVDATGLGAGVLDRLSELGYAPRAWVAAAKPFKPNRFANVKAESWWQVREMFREGLVDLDPQDTVLAGQLAAQRYQLTSSGRLEMTAKREMGGPSPDHADACVIALRGASGASGQGAAFLKVYRDEVAENESERPSPPELRHLPRHESDLATPQPGCAHRWQRWPSGDVCVLCNGWREVAA